MDRDFIARNQIVERYISGRLPIKGATEHLPQAGITFDKFHAVASVSIPLSPGSTYWTVTLPVAADAYFSSTGMVSERSPTSV